MSDFIYLASQSPRRRELLTQWGVPHELLLPDADEDAEALEQVKPNEAPATYVQRVTGLKLDAAVSCLPCLCALGPRQALLPTPPVTSPRVLIVRFLPASSFQVDDSLA